MSEGMDAGGEQGKTGGPEIRPEEFFYLKRQAEKMERELVRLRERATGDPEEAGRLREELAELREQLAAAQRKAARATALLEAGLPAELAELVPEGDAEQVARYTEKLKRLAERMSAGAGAGTNTNPAASRGEESRLRQLAELARQGNDRALREYAHLREEVRAAAK